MRDLARPASLIAPGVLVGIGLAGLLDGIVFRRLLDWHHMLTSQTALAGTGIADNLRGDGILDAASLILLIAGGALMWDAARRLAPRGGDRAGVHLTGWILVGGAAFTLVEGIVFHLVLDWHHINETAGVNEAAWDWGLLIGSVVVGLVGLAMTRTPDVPGAWNPRPDPSAPGRPPSSRP